MQRAERLARRVGLAAVVVGAVLPFATEPAAAQVGQQVVTFSTVPATPGVRILSGGHVVRTDAGGQVTLVLPPAAAARAAEGLRPTFTLPRVLRTPLRSGLVARFGGFFRGGRTIGLSLYARGRLRYTRLDGTPVAASDVRSAELLSSTGVRVTVHGGTTPELQATRVVGSGAGLRSTPIEYAVQSVDVGGGNVVHRAQWRFEPVRKRALTVPLLLYSLRFTSADALFGTPLGSAISLRYPDGRVVQLPLHDGKARATGLPRGSYSVTVKAPGYSFARPVSLSRDQLVDVQVISYLDFTVVIGALAAVALMLLLVGRPLLRRRVRRLASGPLRRARAVARR